MKPNQTTIPLKRKNMALLAEEEVSHIAAQSSGLQVARLKYDEDYFEDPRIDAAYKGHVARALVSAFGDLSLPLWRKHA